MYGEDETFELCKDTFPKEATIKCIENRHGYDITIKATPCDGIYECRDGSDEQCEEDKLVYIGILAGLVALTNIVYHYLKWYQLGWNSQIICDVPIGGERNFSYLMGDDLAELKVGEN